MKVYGSKFTNEKGEEVLVEIKQTNKGITILKPHQHRRPFSPLEASRLAGLLVWAGKNKPNGTFVDEFEDSETDTKLRKSILKATPDEMRLCLIEDLVSTGFRDAKIAKIMHMTVEDLREFRSAHG